MRIDNQEIKELQVINTEDDLIISITDDDVIVLDGYKVAFVTKDSMDDEFYKRLEWINTVVGVLAVIIGIVALLITKMLR